MKKDGDSINGLLTSRSDTVLWTIVVFALSLGSGSGLYSVASTQDRITRTEFDAEIRNRDTKISFLELRGAEDRQELHQLKTEVKRHENNDHPPKHVTITLADHEQRIRKGGN